MIESISDILIITDVDGTLLREKSGISKENLVPKTIVFGHEKFLKIPKELFSKSFFGWGLRGQRPLTFL